MGKGIKTDLLSSWKTLPSFHIYAANDWVLRDDKIASRHSNSLFYHRYSHFTSYIINSLLKLLVELFFQETQKKVRGKNVRMTLNVAGNICLLMVITYATECEQANYV